MIDLHINVELEDGTSWSVKPSIGTYVKFERQYKLSVQSLSNGSLALEHLVWLAWEQARHEGKTVPPFDQFIEQVGNIKLDKTASPLVGTPSPTT
jgi:hypothetical protein